MIKLEVKDDVPSALIFYMIRLESCISYGEGSGACYNTALLASNRRGTIGTVSRNKRGRIKGVLDVTYMLSAHTSAVPSFS
jgi:hypothetical protein